MFLITPAMFCVTGQNFCPEKGKQNFTSWRGSFFIYVCMYAGHWSYPECFSYSSIVCHVFCQSPLAPHLQNRFSHLTPSPSIYKDYEANTGSGHPGSELCSPHYWNTLNNSTICEHYWLDHYFNTHFCMLKYILGEHFKHCCSSFVLLTLRPASSQ